MPQPTPPFPPHATSLALDQSHLLCRHFKQCEKARSRWFGLAVVADHVHGVLAPRLATTVAVAVLALALALQWL